MAGAAAVAASAPEAVVVAEAVVAVVVAEAAEACRSACESYRIAEP